MNAWGWKLIVKSESNTPFDNADTIHLSPDAIALSFYYLNEFLSDGPEGTITTVDTTSTAGDELCTKLSDDSIGNMNGVMMDNMNINNTLQVFEKFPVVKYCKGFIDYLFDQPSLSVPNTISTTSSSSYSSTSSSSSSSSSSELMAATVDVTDTNLDIDTTATATAISQDMSYLTLANITDEYINNMQTNTWPRGYRACPQLSSEIDTFKIRKTPDDDADTICSIDPYSPIRDQETTHSDDEESDEDDDDDELLGLEIIANKGKGDWIEVSGYWNDSSKKIKGWMRFRKNDEIYLVRSDIEQCPSQLYYVIDIDKYNKIDTNNNNNNNKNKKEVDPEILSSVYSEQYLPVHVVGTKTSSYLGSPSYHPSTSSSSSSSSYITDLNTMKLPKEKHLMYKIEDTISSDIHDNNNLENINSIQLLRTHRSHLLKSLSEYALAGTIGYAKKAVNLILQKWDKTSMVDTFKIQHFGNLSYLLSYINISYESTNKETQEAMKQLKSLLLGLLCNTNNNNNNSNSNGNNDTQYEILPSVMSFIRNQLTLTNKNNSPTRFPSQNNNLTHYTSSLSSQPLSLIPVPVPVSRSIVRVIETAHPYESNCDISGIIHIPEAKYLKLVFDPQSSTQDSMSIEFLKANSNNNTDEEEDEDGDDERQMLYTISIGGLATSKNKHWPGVNVPPIRLKTNKCIISVDSDENEAVRENY